MRARCSLSAILSNAPVWYVEHERETASIDPTAIPGTARSSLGLSRAMKDRTAQ